MKIGMLFPGFSNQFVGMGKELYDNSRIIQEYFEEASNCLGINFVKLCFASSDAELARPEHAYPALLLVSTALIQMVREFCREREISLIGGYGVGEYGALCAAKSLSFPDSLYLLSKLALFSGERENEQKSVLIPGLMSRTVAALCKTEPGAYIARYQNDKTHLVSGTIEAVDAVVEKALEAGSGKIKNVEGQEGYHTPLLQEVADQLRIYLAKVDFKDAQIPFITGVTGKVVSRAARLQDAVIKQIVEPLQWQAVLKRFAGVDLIIVPSPSKKVVADLMELYPEKMIMGIETLADMHTLVEYLQEPLVGELIHELA